MTTTMFELSTVQTVDVKNVGQVTFDVSAWGNDFVASAVRYACRIKIDQARNKKVGIAAGEYRTEQEKREAIELAIETLRKGEWTQRATAAATLDECEKQLRSVLADQFVKAGQKKSEAAKMATQADRWDLFRTLVVQKKLASVASSKEDLAELMLKLDDRTNAARHTLENLAENRAAAILKMLQETEVELF